MMQLRYVHLLLVTTTLLAPLVRPPPVAASMTTGRAPILSVAVLLHQRSIQIGGTRGFRVLDHRTSGQLDLQWGGTRVAVDGWMAGLKFRNGNYHKLVVCPTSGGFVLINGKPYRGYFELHEDGRGGVNAVNIVDLESYLYGVVKAEMSASAPLEALKAQAVAARTYAFRNRDTFRSRGYGLKANEQSQVYGGVNLEDPRTARAVNDTRGILVTYRGEAIEALFHAACGGVTENNEEVWASPPAAYERAVACPGCRRSPLPPWKARFDYPTIAKRLRAYGWNVGEITRITTTMTSTGRIKDVMVHSSTGTARVPGNNFRIMVDRKAIRSLRWMGQASGTAEHDEDDRSSVPSPTGSTAMGQEPEPEVEGDGSVPAADTAIRDIIGRYVADDPGGRFLEVMGVGWGHGVGLCQRGAKLLAETGRSYPAILRTYYTGAQLGRAY